MIRYILFWGVLLLQWYLLLTEILIPRPHTGTMGWIDESIWALLTGVCSLVAVSITWIWRDCCRRTAVTSAVLILLLCLGAILYYSDYYENAGMLPFSIKPDNRNPIMRYSENFPPKISVLYGLAGFNALLAIILYRLQRIRKLLSGQTH